MKRTLKQVLSLPFQPSHPQWSKRFCYERMELMGDAALLSESQRKAALLGLNSLL